MSKVLTAARRRNLDKLATYLEALPEDYEHFGMGGWLVGASAGEAARYARENGGVASCATAACAIGHGPAAGILVPACFRSGHFVDWRAYAQAMFSGNLANRIWAFGSAWDANDDTPQGAAARIRYLLNKGEPPEDFDEPAGEWLPVYASYRVGATP